MKNNSNTGQKRKKILHFSNTEHEMHILMNILTSRKAGNLLTRWMFPILIPINIYKPCIDKTMRCKYIGLSFYITIDDSTLYFKEL